MMLKYSLLFILLALFGCTSPGVDPNEECDVGSGNDLIQTNDSQIGSVSQALLTGSGGTIPLGWGMYHDGRSVDTIPASDRMIRWLAYNAVDEVDRDAIAYGVATIDFETLDYKILNRETTQPADWSTTLVWFSGKPDPLWPECTDTTPGGCTLGSTSCITVTKVAGFDMCSEYRVSLYLANIQYGADTRGVDVEDFEASIVRHEITHTLGFWHGSGGPMNNNDLPLTPCQLAMLQTYTVNTASTTWTKVTVPECQ